MLNSDALQQLRQLKAQIQADKPVLEGVITFCASRSATLTLDDGRRLPLVADDVPRILIGDRLRVALEKNADGQECARIEAFLAQPFAGGTGRLVARGNTLFLEPDHARMNRWLFVPPHQKGGAEGGDWVRYTLLRHPQKDGKAAVKVTERLGREDDPFFHRQYAIARGELPAQWPESLLADARTQADALYEAERARREDLTGLDFLTIDNASTEDMDDALFVEPVEAGWRLHVAIADPAALIPAGSALDEAARARGTTAYFPGCALPMLPPFLANDRCSLVAGEERLALVATLAVGPAGDVTDCQWREALIRSRARLTYAEAADCLSGGDGLSAPLAAQLRALDACARALGEWRRAQSPSMDDRPDYDLVTDEQGQLVRIDREERNAAHRLVEACMLAVNLQAALWLRERGVGVFIVHAGLRADRVEQARTVVQAQAPALSDLDLQTLEGYVALTRALDAAPPERPVRAILSRLLERSRLSRECQSHFGLGAPGYTTVTSPIRKYNDLLVHRMIRAVLRQEPQPSLDDAVLSALQDSLDRVRQSVSYCETGLQLGYAQTLLGQTFEGVIVQVNGGGFVVRLDANGLQGFVDLRGYPDKLSFDAVWFAHAGEHTRFELDQRVTVRIHEVDGARRTIRLQLVA